MHWVESFPLVLLGIRTALKSDLQCSTVELVYGTTLRLPGEFFQQSTTDTPPDPMILVTRLRDTMCEIRATPVRPQPQRNVHVSKDLSSCTHVFIRHDAVRKPLQQPYDGPYRVLARAGKHFKIDINGRQDTVSLDCLKPAHLAPTNSPDGLELTPVPSILQYTTHLDLHPPYHILNLHHHPSRHRHQPALSVPHVPDDIYIFQRG